MTINTVLTALSILAATVFTAMFGVGRGARRLSAATMSERLDVSVTYDASCGYIGSVPGLKAPVVALSLGGLRRRIEILMLPDDVVITLSLDRIARRERDRRRQQAQLAR